MTAAFCIETPRTRLRPWRDGDRLAFAALHSDPEVMADLGGPIDAAASGAKLDRYRASYDRHGFCRWAIESRDGTFLGYAGVMREGPAHPLGPHHGIGWRLVRTAWGQGYATEAASAALDDAFRRLGLAEVLAYTAPNNARSRAVMARLGLQRDPARDFTLHGTASGDWSGLTWTACPA